MCVVSASRFSISAEGAARAPRMEAKMATTPKDFIVNEVDVEDGVCREDWLKRTRVFECFQLEWYLARELSFIDIETHNISCLCILGHTNIVPHSRRD